MNGSPDFLRASSRSSVAQLEETVLDVLLRLTSSYFEIARTIQLEAILKDSLTEHQRLVESMERRVEQEVSPRSDLELVTSRAAQVEQQLSLTIAQRYTNRQRLAEPWHRSTWRGVCPVRLGLHHSRHLPVADGLGALGHDG